MVPSAEMNKNPKPNSFNALKANYYFITQIKKTRVADKAKKRFLNTYLPNLDTPCKTVCVCTSEHIYLHNIYTYTF